MKKASNPPPPESAKRPAPPPAPPQMRAPGRVKKQALIAQQALEIANLKEGIADLNERMGNIRMVIYCIGGPLNDNKLGYSRAQMGNFFEIAELAYQWEAGE